MAEKKQFLASFEGKAFTDLTDDVDVSKTAQLKRYHINLRSKRTTYPFIVEVCNRVVANIGLVPGVHPAPALTQRGYAIAAETIKKQLIAEDLIDPPGETKNG